MDLRAAPLPASELKLRFKIEGVARNHDDENLTTTTDDHRAAPSSPPPSSEAEEMQGISNTTTFVAPPSPPEEHTGKRIKIDRLADRVVPPPLSSSEKGQIMEVARLVVEEPDGQLTEKVLLRLFGITRNKVRWGFLSPEHPLHPYYLRRKGDVERMLHSQSQLDAAEGASAPAELQIVDGGHSGQDA